MVDIFGTITVPGGKVMGEVKEVVRLKALLSGADRIILAVHCGDILIGGRRCISDARC